MKGAAFSPKCPLCGSAMARVEVPRFGQMIRFVGYVIWLPNLLLLCAGVMLFAMVWDDSDIGVAIAALLLYSFEIFMLIVGMAVGRWLTGRRKKLLCGGCRHSVDAG